MDDDDLLGEILLRLPPLPSALPRASLVCKSWRRLVSDPAFLRRFRAHHRRLPVLGFFSTFGYPTFIPALNPPDQIPSARFSFRPGEVGHYQFLGCRHGRALVVKRPPRPFLLLWDPVTGDQTRLAVPPELYGDGTVILTGALLCSAGDQGHAHGDCRRPGHFQVALPLGAAGKRKPLALVGFDEENNVTLVRTSCGVFMVHLQSMTFKRLCNSGSARDIHIYHAFPSFYAAGNGIGDRHDEGEALDDMLERCIDFP